MTAPLRAGRAAPLAAGLALAASVLATTHDARAWYFPEHVVIAHDAIMQLPPAVRGVLQDAVTHARNEGLSLCARMDLPLEAFAQKKPIATRMIRAAMGVDCVPYVALSALAGDHASSVGELQRVITSDKGKEIVSAVAYEWGSFQEALARLPNAPLERMSFVHALDVALYFVDPGYELRAQGTQAHFVDAGRSLEDSVRRIAATQGVETALAQFLAHHLRSLQLAARGAIAEGILEHAFAMHFLEDAFAAGHLVMTEDTWRSGNAAARRRHDFFNARGLGIGRAMSVESCAALSAGSLEFSGLTPCWVTSGDGYLGTSADASDRLHAARASTQADLEFALAVDPGRVVAAVNALGERDQLALGQLIEPVPWWTVDVDERSKLRASAARTMRLFRGAAVAVGRLGADAPMPAIAVGSPPPPSVFDARALLDAFDACRPAADVDPSLVDETDVAPCGPGRTLVLGNVGVSLVRPILVQWPASQEAASTLRGESNQDFGWAAQLLASVGASVAFPPHAPVDFFGPVVGVSGGLSYRWGTYLPGRLNRAIGELNVGISEALQYDSRGNAGGNPHVTMLDQELRWPIAWELLTSYKLPLDMAKSHYAGTTLFFNGVRVHEIVTNPTPVFSGIELEAFALALSNGRGAYPLYLASPELRLYLGAADPDAARRTSAHAWGPTLGIELTGGYATFF